MKIGFINGPKDKTNINTDNFPEGNAGEVFRAYDERRGFQTGINPTEVFHYKRLLLKHNNELKYFYVINVSSVEELKGMIEEYWQLSEIVGYDLDQL